MKTFVIRDKAIAERACAFIHSVVGADPPMAVVISEYHGKRTIEQNDAFHAQVRKLSEEGWLAGKQWAPEVWKVHILNSGGFCDVIPDPFTGELMKIPKSTSKMTVKEFSELLNYTARSAAEIGVEL